MKQLKKIKRIVIGLIFCSLLISCESSSVAVNKFIGTYSLTAYWKMIVTIDGEDYSNTQNYSSRLEISKSDEGSNIVDTRGWVETKGIVKGKTITLNPTSGRNTDENGGTTVMNITFQSGTLKNKTIEFKATITGTYYYMGSAYPMVGEIYHVATKLY